jgi:hypothetical protein
MNVKELREYLAQFPDEMEVIIRRYSDYDLLDSNDGISVEKGVRIGETPWITRWHPSMDEVRQAMARDYLLIHGN